MTLGYDNIFITGKPTEEFVLENQHKIKTVNNDSEETSYDAGVQSQHPDRE